MEITYRTQDGFQVPNLLMPQTPEVHLGKYAELRRAYLKKRRRVLYTNLKTSGKLTEHLAEIEQTARKMVEQTMARMAQNEGRDRGTESDRSPALDRSDEQSPAQRGGTGAQRPDLQLTTEEPTEAGSDELPAFAAIGSDAEGGDLAETLPAIGEFYTLYREVKRQHPDAIIFTKLRDGYLSFQEDARLLETFSNVKVTQRERIGTPNRISVCFIPHVEMEDQLTQLDALHKPVILADKQPGEEIEMLRIEPKTQRTLTRAYQVAAYHHFENGFDDKLDYQTLEEAEAAAQGYVAGTMEEDGFAYDGAAVYDAETRQCLRVYGDYPDEKAQEQAAAFALEHDTAQQNTAELPAFLDMHLIEANLLDDGGRKHKRQEIFEYFQAHKSLAERTEFLKTATTIYGWRY